MTLAKPVVVLNAGGKELIPKGCQLEKWHIRRLDQWEIEHIDIETFDDYEPNKEEVFSGAIRLLAKQTYEDAISSLTKISRSLITEGSGDSEQITQSISRLLEVISLEEGLLSLLSKIKEADEYIYQHNVDVCVKALIVAKSMDISLEDQYTLGTACLLHDIGLTRYQKDKWDNSLITRSPDNIIRHPLASAEIASGVKGITSETLEIISQHHEYIDGSGYPNGIRNREIHRLARLLAVADAHTTLISPYDTANRVDPHKATTIVIDPRYNRFDPAVIRAFVSRLAIFPAGTFVMLNNSLRAVVIATNKEFPLRPKLLILYDAKGDPVTPYQVDLVESDYIELFIEEELASNSIMKSIEHIVKA